MTLFIYIGTNAHLRRRKKRNWKNTLFEPNIRTLKIIFKIIIQLIWHQSCNVSNAIHAIRGMVKTCTNDTKKNCIKIQFVIKNLLRLHWASFEIHIMHSINQLLVLLILSVRLFCLLLFDQIWQVLVFIKIGSRFMYQQKMLHFSSEFEYMNLM